MEAEPDLMNGADKGKEGSIMFGKLLKYEWKAMMKTMLPIYGAALVLAAVNGFLLQSVLGGFIGRSRIFSTMQTAAVTLYMLALGAMGVFTAVMIIQRFYKGLLKQEGYLMFTLPVKTWKLIFSKACISFLVSACSMTVGILTIGLFGGLDFLRVLIELPAGIFNLFREGYQREPALCMHMLAFALELLLGLAAAAFASIYELYFSMALGQLSRNHKVIWSVIWFMAVSTVMNFAAMLLMGNGMNLMDFAETAEEIAMRFHMTGLGMLAVQAVSLAILMFGTGYVLDRKLNLE